MKLKLLLAVLVTISLAACARGPQTSVQGAKFCGISTTPTAPQECAGITGDFSGPNR